MITIIYNNVINWWLYEHSWEWQLHFFNYNALSIYSLIIYGTYSSLKAKGFDEEYQDESEWITDVKLNVRLLQEGTAWINNTYALTVHNTQRLTLPDVFQLNLDFENVALSRCKNV